jgi:HSP20 family protein
MSKFKLFFKDKAEPISTSPQATPPEDWAESGYEGELSVDVYQNEESLIIKSTMAGVKPEDLDITINNDLVTIKGSRYLDEQVRPEDYFYQECYWGGFSRSIILPVEVRSEAAQANLKNGVLTLILPKAEKGKTISVDVANIDDEETD